MRIRCSRSLAVAVEPQLPGSISGAEAAYDIFVSPTDDPSLRTVEEAHGMGITARVCRLSLKGFVLGVIAVLSVWSFSPPSTSEAAPIKSVDFENGSCTSWLYGCIRGNTVNTFSALGIPPLKGGGNYAASLHSTGGQDDAATGWFLYNVNYPNIYVRFYFYIPAGFVARSNPANTLKFVAVRDPVSGDRDVYLFGDPLQFNNQISICRPANVLTGIYPSRGTWHYMEVHVDANRALYEVWLDTDSRSSTASYSYTWPASCFGNPTFAVGFNLNWSGGLAPQDQDWYIDGIQADTAPIGDAYGLLSGGSSDTTPPSTPGNVRTAAVSPSQIDVSWDASSDNLSVSGYKLYRDGVEVASVSGIGYQDTGRQPSTTYKYRVSAFDAAGNSSPQSAEASGTTLAGALPATSECENWQVRHPEWIWCDDFEDATPLAQKYFEYDDNGGDFVPVSGVGKDGSTGMRVRWQAGEVSAGNFKRSFGRNPSGSQSHSTQDFAEIYWRMYVRTQPGWTGGGGYKLSRATTLAASNWAQGMIAHVWTSGTNNEYLAIDPASGIDADGNLVSTKYNDFNNLRWLGLKVGTKPLFSSANAGTWFCVEAHAHLNSPGQSDGIFELWIDDVLQARSDTLNWHGSWNLDPNNYMINAIFFENYWNNGSPVTQERYWDNIVISTQRIGCGSGTVPVGPPAPPASLTVR